MESREWRVGSEVKLSEVKCERGGCGNCESERVEGGVWSGEPGTGVVLS